MALVISSGCLSGADNTESTELNLVMPPPFPVGVGWSRERDSNPPGSGTVIGSIILFSSMVFVSSQSQQLSLVLFEMLSDYARVRVGAVAKSPTKHLMAWFCNKRSVTTCVLHRAYFTVQQLFEF